MYVIDASQATCLCMLCRFSVLPCLYWPALVVHAAGMRQQQDPASLTTSDVRVARYALSDFYVEIDIVWNWRWLERLPLLATRAFLSARPQRTGIP